MKKKPYTYYIEEDYVVNLCACTRTIYFKRETKKKGYLILFTITLLMRDPKDYNIMHFFRKPPRTTQNIVQKRIPFE